MAQMAYDTASAQLILVGGERQVETQSTPIIKATALDDTWVLLGTTWIRLHPITSPPKELLTAAYIPPTGNDPHRALCALGPGECSLLPRGRGEDGPGRGLLE